MAREGAEARDVTDGGTGKSPNALGSCIAHGRRAIDIGTALDWLRGTLALPLAVAGALLFLLGTWAPWTIGVVTAALPDGLHTSAETASGSDTGLSVLLTLLHVHPTATRSPLAMWSYVVLIIMWNALPFSGLLLALALWQGPSRTLARIYGAWLALATVITAAGVSANLTRLGYHTCAGGCVTVNWSVAWGMWLTLGALALGWLALLGLARDAHLLAMPNAQPGTRSQIVLVGVGSFTLGLVLWAAAVLLLPWVTAGCAGVSLSLTHFARGACMGYDGYDVLSTGLANSTAGNLVDVMWSPAQAALNLIESLAGTGLILAILLWRPRKTRAHRSLRVPALIWLVLALGIFAVCWRGTRLQIASGGHVVVSNAPLVMGPGVWPCVLGLTLVAVGVVGIWIVRR